jgi:hypothetical protein
MSVKFSYFTPHLPNAKVGKIKPSRFAPSDSSIPSNLKRSIADYFNDGDVPKRKKQKTRALEAESDDVDQGPDYMQEGDASRVDAQPLNRKRQAHNVSSKKVDEHFGRDHDEELAVAQLVPISLL